MVGSPLNSRWLSMVALILGLPGVLVLAQEKIAEGEYALEEVSDSGVPAVKTATRWILYNRSSGGYHLESDIQNLPPGMRLIQIEELDTRLAPISIAYELYVSDAKTPTITVKCESEGNSIMCGGQSEARKKTVSKRFKLDGSFWLYLENQSALDMPWLIDGAVNLAQKGTLKGGIGTLTVSGGAASELSTAINDAKVRALAAPGTKVAIHGPRGASDWELHFEEERTLETAGSEVIEINALKIPATHFVLKGPDESMDLWIAAPGILLKADNVVLINYRQYKKLIPELGVESAPTHGESASKVP